MKARKYLPGAILVVAVTLVLRLPHTLLVPILDTDEASYATRAAALIKTGGTLYVDIVEDTPPLMNCLYMAVFRLAGMNNLVAVRLLGAAWVLLTTAVLYRIALLLGDRRAAFLTAIFYSVTSTTFDPREMIAANTELFMVLPLAVGALFFLRGLRGRSGRNYWLAGIFCAAGFLFKQPGIVDLAAMILFLALLALAGKTSIREAGKRASLVLAGFLGPLAAILAYLFYQGALEKFYYWTLKYRFDYAAAVPAAIGARTALKMLSKLTLSNFGFWAFVPISLFFLKKSKFKSGYAFCWLWGIFSLAGAAAGRRPAHHYYIQAIPPFAVLAGLGAEAAIDWSISRGRKAWQGVLLKAGIAASLTAAVLITHPGSLRAIYGPQERNLYRLQRLEHPAQKLAERIREKTSESDSIYAWGFYPEIYYLANRLPASRFVTADFIVGASPGGTSSIPVRDVWETFLKDLKSNRPTYFIDNSMSYPHWIYADHPVARYLLLWRYLHTNYEIESVIDNNLVYRRREKSLAEKDIHTLEDENSRTIHDATLALTADSGFVLAYYFRGLAFQRLGRNQAALEDFNRALETDPTMPIDFRTLGALYLSEGRTAEAIREFQKAVSIDPFRPEAHHNLAAAFDQAGDFSRAIEQYRRAIELKPDFAPTYMDLGFAYAKSGLLEEAATVFEKAVELNPESGPGYYCLALCHYFRGDHAAAVFYRDQAIRFGYREIHGKIMELK